MSHPADASSVSGDAHGALRPLPTAESDTARLAERARRDLAALAHPAAAWVRPALRIGATCLRRRDRRRRAERIDYRLGPEARRRLQCIIARPQLGWLRGSMGDLRPHGGAAFAKGRGWRRTRHSEPVGARLVRGPVRRGGVGTDHLDPAQRLDALSALVPRDCRSRYLRSSASSPRINRWR